MKSTFHALIWNVHALFEALGYVVAALLYWRERTRPDSVDAGTRLTVIGAAGAGAVIGARLLSFLSYPDLWSGHLAQAVGGKTIVGGLLGGLIAVEWTKKRIGVRASTGDRFVLPLVAAIAIGRIGCFLTGPADNTAGIPSDLPWAIAIGDAVPRHPVALYEIGFLLLLTPLLIRAKRLHPGEGVAFRLFMTFYLAFRLGIDFLKPEPPALYAGLSTIQFACALGLLYYAFVWTRAPLPRQEPA